MSQRRLPLLVLLLLTAVVAAAEHRSHTRAEVTETRPDGTTHSYHVNRHDRVDSDRTDDGRRWHRETDVRRSDGIKRDVVADGEVHRDGEGGGSASIARQAVVSHAGGERVIHETGVEARWRANDQGGTDSERLVDRSSSTGRSSHTRTQRRSSDAGEGVTDFVQQIETSSDGDDRSVKWERGRRTLTRRDDGYVLRTDVVGQGDRGGRWTREHSHQVRKHADGRYAVLDATATRHGSGEARYEVLQGIWTPLGDGSAEGRAGRWRFEGSAEVREGSQVRSRREIRRDVTRLPVVDPADERGLERLAEGDDRQVHARP